MFNRCGRVAVEVEGTCCVVRGVIIWSNNEALPAPANEVPAAIEDDDGMLDEDGQPELRRASVEEARTMGQC